MPLILFQHITTKWTKFSRGMPHAARRNAVPKTLPIPPLSFEDGKNLLYHKVSATEKLHFHPNQETSWHDLTLGQPLKSAGTNDSIAPHNWFTINKDRLDICIPLYSFHAPYRGYTTYDITRHFPGKTVIHPTKLPFNTITPLKTDKPSPIKMACLSLGQTFQFEINEKQTFVRWFNGESTYFQHVMNFHFTDKFIPDIFQTKSFDKHTNMKSYLF